MKTGVMQMNLTTTLKLVVLILCLGLFLGLATGQVQSSLTTSIGAEPNVLLRVALKGQPADAQIKVLQGNKVVTVAYTDVHKVGLAQFRLPAGAYTLLIDHGGGFTAEVVSQEITIPAKGSLELNVELEKLFEPNGWGYYSADTHAHTKVSYDGLTPVDQAVGVQLAADLDLVFISDHNSVKGHTLFAKTAQERGVPFLLSEEVSTDWSVVNMGHFNPYSLKPGSLVSWWVEPAKLFKEARQKGAKIIQVNHPKDGRFDYFNLLEDPRFDPSFDVVEVFNGEFSLGDQLTLEQMFAFWNQGKRYVAVAASDDHDWKALDVEYGRPRTYVFVAGELTVDKWLQSLKEGHAFATYGPLINLKANGKYIPGDTVKLAAKESLILEAEIKSVTPLLKGEVIKNGNIVEEVPLEGREKILSFQELPEANAWYIVRVFAENGDQAITNPIWVEIGS